MKFASFYVFLIVGDDAIPNENPRAKNVFKLLKHTLLSIILRVQTNFKYVLILFEGEWSRLLSVSEKCYVDSRLLETVY